MTQRGGTFSDWLHTYQYNQQNDFLADLETLSLFKILTLMGQKSLNALKVQTFEKTYTISIIFILKTAVN